ncbi:MobQ family relaxase [Waltera intestinalis]|uniref:MobA/MobL family protein n=1 Tax=Waltera intestinalis TaxID=2606635 RepID=A0A6L5YHG6_9FIRM|nr:MobQ family relaxase [Waltera intestinalis]MST57701.1 MobA/MobL family protein [Waltera intestinalis]
MALYHFHVSRVLRSRGQSSVEAAAYRAGERLEDHYYGKIADYTAKGGVICAEIMAPDYVPESFHNREYLWNAVEEVEKHPKAQLAYSFDIALQNEFTIEENIAIARQFVMENLVAKGMIVDMAVHDPDKGEGIPNPHIHVMCPVRPMREDGTWGEKQKREYLFDVDGNPILDEKGKQKFNAVPTTDWNRPEVLEQWRKAWADLVNEEFRKRGIKEQIDYRSYAEQGIDLIPQVHEGPHVRNMEAKGIVTEKGNLNRWIKEVNKGILMLSKQVKDILANIAELMRLIAEKEAEAKQPDLADYINSYFAKRNETADTFSRGRQKAKATNLKMHATVINYLMAKHIATLEDFKSFLSEKQSDIHDLNESMKVKSARMKELKDMIRYGEWYQEAQPILRDLCSTKNGKRKAQIKSENDEVLRRYPIAKRILFEEKKIDRVDVSEWKSEVASLQDPYQEEYEKYKKLSSETKLLRDINKYIDDAICNTQPRRKEAIR